MVIFARHKKTMVFGVVFLCYISAYVLLVPKDLFGRHAWDEANYLNIVANELNSVTTFNQKFDNQRPDFNAGFYLVWIYLCLKQALSLLSLKISVIGLGRSISIAFTLLSAVVIYRILCILDGHTLFREKIFTVALFLLSPIILWYGSKFKLEPILFFFFLLSLYYHLRDVGKSSYKSKIVSGLLFGTCLSIKMNMLFMAPIYILDLSFLPRRRRTHYVALISSFAASVALGLFAPIVVTDGLRYLQGDPVIAYTFFWNRLVNVQSLASAIDPHFADHPVLELLKNTVFLGLSYYTFYALIGLLIIKREGHIVRHFYVVLFVLSLIYFSVTYRHNVVHDYHVYYFMLPGVIGSYYTLKAVGSRKGILSLVVVSVLVGGVHTELLFKAFSKSWDDPHGNVTSKMGGEYVAFIYERMNLQGYVLDDSPVVTFYSRKPSVGYTEFYVYDFSAKKYNTFYDWRDKEIQIGYFDSVDIISNCEVFWEFSDKYKPIVLIYGDPLRVVSYYDLRHQVGRLEACSEYIQNNFKEVGRINHMPILVRKEALKVAK